ncbi:MAG: hypothetical protein J6S14_08825 [Clostridia bacterium]|nr:hypothetical protein [Clostridia bacterium]
MKRRPRYRKKNFKGLFSKIAVALIITQVFVYTWVHLILSYKVGLEISPTVSCALYAFCGAEAGLLAWIKNTKTKNESGESENERTDYSETDQP